MFLFENKMTATKFSRETEFRTGEPFVCDLIYFFMNFKDFSFVFLCHQSVRYSYKTFNQTLKLFKTICILFDVTIELIN